MMGCRVSYAPCALLQAVRGSSGVPVGKRVDIALLPWRPFGGLQGHSRLTLSTRVRTCFPSTHDFHEDGEGSVWNLEMGGMLTVLKVRDGIATYEDPGLSQQPEWTAPRLVK